MSCSRLYEYNKLKYIHFSRTCQYTDTSVYSYFTEHARVCTRRNFRFIEGGKEMGQRASIQVQTAMCTQ